MELILTIYLRMQLLRRNDMIEFIIIIVICVILLAYSIVVTVGMIRGLKKVELYESIFENVKTRANMAYTQMKEVDTLGAFEADDDVGAIFDEIKALVDELNNYIVENINE